MQSRKRQPYKFCFWPHGIGAEINGKHRAQQLDAIDDPLSTVLKVKSAA